MDRNEPTDFKLGDALVRLRSRTIETGGESQQLDHKALQVLSCLVRQAGAVIRKQDIFDQVWPQTHVSDDVLTGAISRLRRALGDDTRAPRFIETVPSVGYRLIAAVEPFGPIEPVEAIELPEAHSKLGPTPPAKLWNWRLAAVLLTLLALFAVALRQQPMGDVPRSIAVLPLDNLTGDLDQAHLAAGTTEALITGLAHQEGLRVLSRVSVQRYASSRPTLDEIAGELEVDLLVEGSVQRSQDRLRISARLIDVAGDRHLWAGSFDGELRDVLDLQAQVVAAMTRELVTDVEVQTAAPTMPVSPAAYESYLRARYLLGQPPTPQRLGNAVQELERVIAEEDRFAAAHIALAEAFLALGEEVLMPPREAFARVRDAAERALTLEPNTARPHALLAMTHFLHDWDFDAAKQRFDGALALDPHDILARDGYSRLLTVTGRFHQALDQQRMLRELNPLIYHQPYLAYIYNMARQHELALQELHRQLTLEHRSPRLYSHLASTYRWLDRPAEAIAPFLTSLHLRGTPAANINGLRDAFERDGIVGVGRFILRHYQGLEGSGESVPAMSRAEAFVYAGDLEAAIRQIERAFDEREPHLLVIVHSPDYDVLRSHPDFQAILGRLGLAGRTEDLNNSYFRSSP